MFPKIRSPYRRAAFWIGVVIVAASAAIYPSTKDSFMTEGHGLLYYAGYVVLLPGMYLGAEIVSVLLSFDPRHGIDIALNGLYWVRVTAAAFSWLIYFGLFSLITRIRTRRKRISALS